MRLIAIHICNVLSVCVCLCICVFDTLVTPAKTDELIIMSFEMWTRGSFPKKPSVIWGPGSPYGKGYFWGSYLGMVDIISNIRMGSRAMRPLASSLLYQLAINTNSVSRKGSVIGRVRPSVCFHFIF